MFDSALFEADEKLLLNKLQRDLGEKVELA
jgi:hypothetical protein